jgi:pSer/pThr/pTyr-binding forkhead associated (FHA) protein
MQDGRTIENRRVGSDPDEFARWEAALVVVEGGAEGSEHGLGRRRVVIGRGPGVDLAFADPEMSQQHAAIEFEDGVFRVLDLGSTNGVAVNGERVAEHALAHGDRIGLGIHVFRILLEKRDSMPRVYVLPDA